MISSAIGDLRDEYLSTWNASGPTGKRFLGGGFAYAIRNVAFTVAFPLFAKERGFDSGQIGLCIALISLSIFAFGIPVMRWGAKGHTRSLLTWAPLLAILGQVILIFTPNAFLPSAAIATFLIGIEGTTFWILGDPLLTGIYTPAQRAHAFALKFAILTIGFAVGGGLGGWIPALGELAGMSRDSALTMTMAVIALFDVAQMLLFRRLPDTKRATEAAASAVRSATRNYRATAAGLGLLLLLVAPEAGMAMGHNAVRPFLSLYFDENFGLSPGSTGTIIAVMMLIGGIGALLLPKMSRGKNHLGSLLVIRIGGAVSIAVVALALNLWVVLLALLWYYGTLDGSEALYITEAMDRVPVLSRTTFSGLATMTWSGASAIGSTLSGYLQDKNGGSFEQAFALAVVGYTFSGLWCFFVLPRLPSLSREAPAESSGTATV